MMRTHSRRQSDEDAYPRALAKRSNSSRTSSVTLVLRTAVCLPTSAELVGRLRRESTMSAPIHPATKAWAEEAVALMLERVRRALMLEYLQRVRELR